jgi:hypothetical protein
MRKWIDSKHKELYLLIADTITAIQNDDESEKGIDAVVDALADAFEGYDPYFDRVQFLTDCELAEASV